MTEHLLPGNIPGAKIAPFARPSVHLNGTLPDHTDADCPRDDTCSVFVEFYDHGQA